MRPLPTFILIVLLAAGGIFLLNKGNKSPAPQPDPDQYAQLTKSIGQHRAELAQEYRQARNTAEREFVLRKTRFLFEEGILHMMNCWLGTPYDFNGMATEPGNGEIACGYFVSTITKDIGLPVNRIAMAQSAAEIFIRKIIARSHIKTFSNRAYPSFLTDLDQLGPGIYIIGLDTHIGFIVTNQNGWHFIHSSTRNPNGVTSQDKENANAIKNSKYRVLGKLVADNDALLDWLNIR